MLYSSTYMTIVGIKGLIRLYSCSLKVVLLSAVSALAASSALVRLHFPAEVEGTGGTKADTHQPNDNRQVVQHGMDNETRRHDEVECKPCSDSDGHTKHATSCHPCHLWLNAAVGVQQRTVQFGRRLVESAQDKSDNILDEITGHRVVRLQP